jgi:PAS domain S-box-containing protein
MRASERTLTVIDQRSGRTQELFRLLVENVIDYAIFMLDPGGRVTTWNPGAERLKGYTPDEIIGRHFSAFYTPADVAAGKPERGLRTALAEGRFEDDGWRVRKDGTLFWANVIITAIHDETGEHRGFAKITRDLTERRRAEGERIKLAQAEEAVRLRDEFLSIAGHELRTPLNALLLHSANLALLLRRGDADASSLLDKAASVTNQGHRLNELIERLLDVTRLSSGSLPIAPETVDLVSVVKEVIATYQPQAEQANSPLRLTAPECVSGIWDPLRLGQIVANLLSNALKHGGGKPVDLSVDTDGAVVRIAVRDYGVGIPREQQNRIFERFERGGAPRSDGGLGLGLYVVRCLAEVHHGTVTVESDLGKGSTFTVSLPLGSSGAEEGRSPEEYNG